MAYVFIGPGYLFYALGGLFLASGLLTNGLSSWADAALGGLLLALGCLCVTAGYVIKLVQDQ